MNRLSTSTACLTCREQHLKCVWSTKKSEVSSRACLRCVSTGRSCTFAPSFRFKHSNGPLATDQPWVRYPKRLRFIDETLDIESHYVSGSESTLESGSPAPYQPSEGTPDIIDAEPLEETLFDGDTGTSRRASSVNSNSYITAPRTQLSRAYGPIPQNSLLGLANVKSVSFPLTKPSEVRLMKYYLEYMCTWFDLCDCRSHFANIVPYRAASSPTLLNAIFALSSRHLSLNGRYDPYASDRYHQECLKHLCTISGDSTDLANDDLLAAIILLRTLEELDVPLLGTDLEGHLLGIQLFMNTPNSTSTPSSLRQASFWIGLRQEITMSSATQRPVKIKLDHAFIDRSFSPADDDTWANRIIVHCAEVMNYCFGNGDRSMAEYQALVDYDQGWLTARPLSWLPIAYGEPDESLNEVFPHILYLNHAVVVGIAHSIYARLLLMCHDDRGPRVGPSARISRKRIDDNIRIQLRELCGTAMSNVATRPAMFTACMGVTACGDRFTDRKDQDALLNILVLTETNHSWPTAAAQAHLRRAWGREEL